MSKERIATLVANLREADDFGQFAPDMTPCRSVVAQLRELLDYLKPDEGTEPFPYQKTFDAIAAATFVSAGHIAISVAKFVEAFGATDAAAPARTDERTTQDAVALDTRLSQICDEVLTDLPGLGVDMGTAFAKEVAVRFAQHLDEGSGQSIEQRLQTLLADAAAEGLKVEVWLHSVKPLAMGNHIMLSSVRPARYPVVETHAQGESE